MKKFDAELDTAIKNTKLWAKNIYNVDTIYTSHLFLGIVGDSYNPMWNIIFASGVEINVMVEKVKMIASSYEKKERINDIFYSKEIEKLFEYADKHSKDNELSSFDIILAMFKVNNDIKETFKDFNFDSEALKETYSYEQIDDFYEEMYSEEEMIGHGIPSNGTKINFDFCENLSEKIKKSKTYHKIVGREKEMKMIQTCLLKPQKNNIILVGEAGVGKTNLIEELALISDYEIYSLDVNKMVSDTKYRGELEKKLSLLVENFKGQENKVLFVDEAHVLKDAGSSESGLSFFNVLKPAMGRGEIKVILATTNEEYAKYIEYDKAITRRCSIIQVKETDVAATKHILERYLDKNKIGYNSFLIDEIYNYANEFMPNKYFPDKAIEIVDNMIATSKYDLLHVNQSDPDLIFLEKEIEQIVRDKAYGKARDVIKRQNKILKSKNKKNVSLELNIDNLKETLNTFYGIKYKDINDIKNFNLYLDKIKQVIKGHDEIIEDILNKILIHYFKKPERPLVLCFLGESGVGKSELAKQIAEIVFDGHILKLDMAEYQHSHTLDQLIGAPAGYVGYNKPGILTNHIQQTPKSVIILDEIEKADTGLHNLFLGAFEDGDIMDRRGVKVNCKNTTFILTSNEGISRLNASIGYNHNINTVDSISILKNKFKPEFLNRIEEFYFFKKPDIDVIKKYAYECINEYEKTYGEYINQNEFIIEESLIYELFRQGGFRHLKRYIKKQFDTLLINKLK